MTWAAGFLKPYVNGNKFATLDDILEEDLKDSFVSGTAEAYEVEGDTYGLPLEINSATVFYNQAIFDEYDLKVPETFEELEEVVRWLKDTGVTPIALGTN